MLDDLSDMSCPDTDTESSDSDAENLREMPRPLKLDQKHVSNNLIISDVCSIAINLDLGDDNVTPIKHRQIDNSTPKPSPVGQDLLRPNFHNTSRESPMFEKKKYLDLGLSDEKDNVGVNCFIAKSGITLATLPKTPLDYFQLFINKNVLKYLVYETNLYASQTKTIKTDSYKQWYPVDLEGMAHYIGLNILFGVFKLPRNHMYWSVGKPFSSHAVRSAMSFQRFQIINTFFHAFNNKAIPVDQNDRIIKIRNFSEYLINKFKSIYIPEKNLSLDEGIMPFKGKLNFKTYNPDKPVKYGIKFYILTEAETGYVHNFSIYSGEGNTTNGIVHKLCEDIKNKGYHIYMDNFYNSGKLAEELLQNQIYICGTLRLNRGAPREFQEKIKYLKNDEVLFKRVNDISFITWQDKRAVSMISTIHSNANTVPIEKIKKKTVKGQKLYSKVTVNKPIAIVDYNKFMGGVDHFDQMIKYYEFIQKSQKWTRKVIFYLLQMAIHNSFQLYKKYCPVDKKVDLLSFHEIIYTSLLEFNEESWPDSPPEMYLNHASDIEIDFAISDDEINQSYTVNSELNSRENIGDSNKTTRTNFFECIYSPAANSSMHKDKRSGKRENFYDLDKLRLDSSLKHCLSIEPKKKRRNCRVCLKNFPKQKLTWYRCESCLVHLCPNNCYSIYHKKKFY